MCIELFKRLGSDLHLFIFKEVTYDYQICIDLIKQLLKLILVEYYYNLKSSSASQGPSGIIRIC